MTLKIGKKLATCLGAVRGTSLKLVLKIETKKLKRTTADNFLKSEVSQASPVTRV